MHSELERIEENTNPLDNVEDVLHAHNWHFNRMADDELVVEIHGKGGAYNLFFIWQEEMQALQFCAQVDLTIMENNIATAKHAILDINENLWMGHFDLPQSTNKPSFRYTCLMRGSNKTHANEIIEDMVDIALAQCEKNHTIFALLASANDINDQTMSLAMMDTVGES